MCYRCEAALGEFLGSITRSPTTVDYPAMVNILIAHSQTHGKINILISFYVCDEMIIYINHVNII